MDDNLIRLIMPVLSPSHQSISSRSKENDDFMLIMPIVLLIMADRKDIFLALALLSILAT